MMFQLIICNFEAVLSSVVTVSRWPRSIGFGSVLGKNLGFSSVQFGFLTSIKTSVDVQ